MRKLLRVLLCIVLMLSVTLPGMEDLVYAEEGSSATVDVRLEGPLAGSQVKVETADVGYEVPGSNEVENTYSSTRGLADNEQTVDAEESFSLTFTHALPGTYDYLVTEIPGSDVNVDYNVENKSYIVRIHVDSDLKSTVVIKESDSDYKPSELCFKNKSTIEEVEETMVVTRTITYTEYTEDGKVVSKQKVQKVHLKRTVRKNKHGEYLDEEGNVIPPEDYKTKLPLWSIDEDYASENDQSAVTSPNHPKKKKEGWKPNLAEVGQWIIDFSDPKDEVVHVIYKPEKKENKTVKTDEYKTITRTITYTEYTKDGKKVSKTIKQKIRIKRTKTQTIDPKTGKVIKTKYSEWKYVSGDRGEVTSPDHPGWLPDIKRVGPWKFDPNDPRDEVIHVVYKPAKEAGRKWYHRFLPRTGDQFRYMLFGGVGLLAALMLLLSRKRKKT